MVRQIITLKEFATQIYDLQKSDRDVNVGVAGFTGEGKSCFSTLLQKEHATLTKIPWGFDKMTWSRKELMNWIDGDKEGKGQLPEYSAILPDELFAMFYSRNWYNEEQIDAIGTLNMCRDRHLFLCGNVPKLWELDGSFLSRLRFYVYIYQRGVAWVFEQENNPFSKDPWNTNDNIKLFRKKKNPYNLPNFLFEIHYPDWSPEEKEEYYHIRNTKRMTAMQDNKDDRKERYHNLKVQRDLLIRKLLERGKCPKCHHDIMKLTTKGIAEWLDMDQSTISLIKEGLC